MALSLNLPVGVALLSSLSLLAACAQTYDPIVDLKGKDRAAHEADVAECRDHAEPDPAKQRAFARFLLGGLFSAGLGTVSGALVGSFVGAAASGAAQGAAVYGTAAVVGGGVSGVQGKAEIAKNCPPEPGLWHHSTGEPPREE